MTDSIGTSRTYTYDRAVEPRGFVTQMVDSVAGTITPTWGPDGQLESQLLPGGVRLTLTYDTARVPTARTYTRVSDGGVIARDSVVENHRGQWITHASDTGVRNYRYDRLGRLTGVDDTSATTDQCTSRTYGYDTHTNRTSFTQATGAASGACPGTTGATTVTSSYDSADRLVSTSGANGSSWTYDLFGRVTGMPVADGSVVAANEYFVNDLVAAQEVPGDTRSVWGLDPLQRFATQGTSVWVDGAWANSTEQVSHFDGDGDEPAWIVEDATVPDVVSRFVEGMDGAVAVATTGTGGRVLQLVDLHGDVTGTLPIGDGEAVASWSGLVFTSFDEFGNPEPLTSAATGNAPPRYGWLGAAQRSADTPTGTILMGVRLYSPVVGRFLQVDPVPGGSASAYDYCSADPVNCTDLGGTFSWKGLVKAVAVVGEIASWIPGPIGAAAAGVSAVAYAASGDTGKAIEMAVTAAANLVGAGAGARAGFKAASVAAKLGQRASRAVVKVERAVARVSRGPGVCAVPNSFVPGTLVVMADGTLRPIEQVEVGDLVLTSDPATGEESAQPVLTPIIGEGDKHLVQVTTESGSWVATAEHPIWVADQGWTDAIDLTPGDMLVQSDGRPLQVSAVVDLGALANQTVYNLSVGNTHTYFVADGQVDLLVHNCGVPTKGAPLLPRAQEQDLARYLGYTRMKGHHSMGMPIYRRGRSFITQDRNAHNGGIWKMARDIRDLGSKSTRSGTYGPLLDRIGP